MKMSDQINSEIFLRGPLRKDRRTKKLLHRLKAGDIALISHRNLDWVSAEGLAKCGVKAVLNTDYFCSGLFPPSPLGYLLDRGIHLVERLPENLFNKTYEGEYILLINGAIMQNGRETARGRVVTTADYRAFHREALISRPSIVDSFVLNTLDYAYRERNLITTGFSFPSLNTSFANRDVVIVVRGKGYREDLKAVRKFIREKKPVLVGVDGGGDALMECGFQPDMIIGDMDSVSDTALMQTRDVVVHAYHDGRGAPGQKRLEELGVSYRIFSAPGTSEDIAMLMAYELGAALIVAIGAHSSVIEFLEKGRKGMSSTFLVRLKVGDRLVDAKGVSRLYSSPLPAYLYPVIIASGLMPLITLAVLSPVIQHLFKLFLFRLQLIF